MNLIVLGAHQDCKKDLEEAQKVFSECDYMAIGLDSMLMYEGDIQYMATFHPCDINDCKKKRKEKGLNTDFKGISHIKEEVKVNCKGGKIEYEVDIIEPYKACREHTSGSSALLGVKVALKVGYDKIILCGCPLIGISGTNYNYKDFQSGWIAAKDLVMGKVKSMSGWTKDYLGYPTKEWANGT